MTETFATTWKEIATSFLKIGATAYGGPAIMGVMQAEIQERRRWTSKPRFLEGLGLVNVLPGATMVQLAIFLGYQRGGWWGGLLAGVCFTAPAFVVMLVLAAAYATFGVSPLLRGALYGLGPVVLAIFIAAVFRLGKSALRSWPHALIATGAAVAALLSPFGAAAILIVAGGVGVLLFYSRRAGVLVLSVVMLAIALVRLVPWSLLGAPTVGTGGPTLGGVAALFTGLGAFTFGGGLSIIALMQEQIVDRLHWLTPREFVDGLALGQLMPGPIIMVAAYVGYKTLGPTGAAVAAAASFVPSFVMMLALLPLFDRVRNLAWARAVIQGIVPGVVGVMAVALVRMAPYAAPDAPAIVVLVLTAAALVVWRLAPLKVMGGGTVFGILRAAVRV
ncbi:MAG TPA: chromate efflux transporter [Methylomirabilota bacterium]|jgi:chromate transporter